MYTNQKGRLRRKANDELVKNATLLNIFALDSLQPSILERFREEKSKMSSSVKNEFTFTSHS